MGHLRSQRRYRVWSTDRPADDLENLAFTRTTNALDGALLVQDLFIEHADGKWRRTPMGDSQLQTLRRYESLVGECAPSLLEDARSVDPAGASYSPLGTTYGFIADVMSSMAQGSLMGCATFGLSLEDVTP